MKNFEDQQHAIYIFYFISMSMIRVCYMCYEVLINNFKNLVSIMRVVFVFTVFGAPIFQPPPGFSLRSTTLP